MTAERHEDDTGVRLLRAARTRAFEAAGRSTRWAAKCSDVRSMEQNQPRPPMLRTGGVKLRLLRPRPSGDEDPRWRKRGSRRTTSIHIDIDRVADAALRCRPCGHNRQARTTDWLTNMATRGYITIAFKEREYLKNAQNLARSLRYASPGTPVAIVTDLLDEDLSEFDQVVPLQVEHGYSLYHKLLIDRYSPFDRSMFIDSDCVVVRDLGPIWDRFEGHSIAIVGTMEYQGEWFGVTIEEIRDKAHISGPLPKFNSGFIYWESGKVSTAVFESAREIWDDYSSLGFSAFRSSLPVADEPLISLALARNNIETIPDDGTVMNTPIGLVGRLRMNLPRHYCRFTKGNMQVAPAIAHFCGYYRRGPVYIRETLWLSDHLAGRTRRARLVRILWAPLAMLDNSLMWGVLRSVKRLVVRNPGK